MITKLIFILFYSNKKLVIKSKAIIKIQLHIIQVNQYIVESR